MQCCKGSGCWASSPPVAVGITHGAYLICCCCGLKRSEVVLASFFIIWKSLSFILYLCQHCCCVRLVFSGVARYLSKHNYTMWESNGYYLAVNRLLNFGLKLSARLALLLLLNSEGSTFLLSMKIDCEQVLCSLFLSARWCHVWCVFEVDFQCLKYQIVIFGCDFKFSEGALFLFMLVCCFCCCCGFCVSLLTAVVVVVVVVASVSSRLVASVSSRLVASASSRLLLL